MKVVGYDVTHLPIRWDHGIEWHSDSGREAVKRLWSAALDPQLNVTTTIRGTDYMVMRGRALDLTNQIFFVATYPDRQAHYAALLVDPRSENVVSELNALFKLGTVGTSHQMAAAAFEIISNAPVVAFLQLLSGIPESTETDIEQLILQVAASQYAP